jgi:hypothetical protein
MNMPGFTADVSLYDMTATYLVVTRITTPAANGLVQASAKPNRGVARFCNSIADNCLNSCSPYDNSCRFSCNDIFFNCYNFNVKRE